MKKECAIVQDLLVLYEDDCLQEESRKMVETHIATCQECRKIYEASEKNEGCTCTVSDRIRLADTAECISDYEKNKKENHAQSYCQYRADCGSYNWGT